MMLMVLVTVGGGHCGLGWSCLLCCSGSVPVVLVMFMVLVIDEL